jgi:hypothetical protein
MTDSNDGFTLDLDCDLNSDCTFFTAERVTATFVAGAVALAYCAISMINDQYANEQQILEKINNESRDEDESLYTIPSFSSFKTPLTVASDNDFDHYGMFCDI